MATGETDGRRACDVNVMLALSPANHAHHKAATSWFEHVGAWAACSITGSACCRLLLNPRVTGFEVALRSGAGAQWLNPRVTGFELCASEVLDALRVFCSVDVRGFMSSLLCLDHLRAVGPPYFVNQEGYSGVVLKAWGVKVVVMVCSGGSGAPSPLRLDSASRMVGRRLACRDAAGSRARHLTREIVT